MRTDHKRLQDILEAIEKIQGSIPEHREDFDENEMLQVWFIHHLQIIGEAANRLSDTTRDQAPAIPWEQIIGMRNILIHAYFGVNLDTVWATVINFIPDLKEKMIRLMATDDQNLER